MFQRPALAWLETARVARFQLLEDRLHLELALAIRTLARLEAKRIHLTLNALLMLDAGDPTLELDPYTKGHLEEIVGRVDRALKASFRLGGR